MLLSRRQCLSSLALGLVACDRVITQMCRDLWGEGLPQNMPPLPMGVEIDPDFHLLSRATYGPWPGGLWRLKTIGQAAWLEQQLHPEQITDVVLHGSPWARAYVAGVS